MQNLDALLTNLGYNAIPNIVMEGNTGNYLEFLNERQKMMSSKVKEFYYKL
jgi:hypothetical protein